MSRWVGARGAATGDIEIRIDRERCIGSGNCVFWAPASFDLGRRRSRHRRGSGRHRRRATWWWPPRAVRSARSPCGAPALPSNQRTARCRSAVSEEHEELRRTVQRWLSVHCPPAVARESLEGGVEEPPPVWKDLARQGWLGLHVRRGPGRSRGTGWSSSPSLWRRWRGRWRRAPCCPPCWWRAP